MRRDKKFVANFLRLALAFICGAYAYFDPNSEKLLGMSGDTSSSWQEAKDSFFTLYGVMGSNPEVPGPLWNPPSVLTKDIDSRDGQSRYCSDMRSNLKVFPDRMTAVHPEFAHLDMFASILPPCPFLLFAGWSLLHTPLQFYRSQPRL